MTNDLVSAAKQAFQLADLDLRQARYRNRQEPDAGTAKSLKDAQKLWDAVLAKWEDVAREHGTGEDRLEARVAATQRVRPA